MKATNGMKVGDKVLCNGFEGAITRVCEWDLSLVEVRLSSGTVCVGCNTVKAI